MEWCSMRCVFDAVRVRCGACSMRCVFDAVRVRLIEIGEAVKDLDPLILLGEPTIPWRDIASMRDHLAHRCFDTSHAIVQATVDQDLPAVLVAVQRLLELRSDEQPA